VVATSQHHAEQNFSLIKFPDKTLRFSNNFSEFETSIADNFPHQIDSFRELDKTIMAFDEVNLNNGFCSARKTVSDYLDDPLLIDMLFCPLMLLLLRARIATLMLLLEK